MAYNQGVYTYLGEYTGGLNSVAYIWGTYIWVLMPGKITEELIYGQLYLEDLHPVAYIGGLISEGLNPGILSGVTYPGTFIQWLITRGLMSGGINRGLIFCGLYLGNLYLSAYAGANNRGIYIW